MQVNWPESAVSDGDTLREARLAARLTQKEAGDLIGVSREAVASYESGRSSVPEKLLRALTRLKAPEILEMRRAILSGEEYTLIDDPSLVKGFSTMYAIQAYRGVLAAGSMEEEPYYEDDDFLEVPTAFLVGGSRNAELHAAVQVNGASMSPRAESGERIVIFRDTTIRPNVISFVKSPDGKRMVKVVRVASQGKYGLASINEAGVTIPDLNGWEMIGYAVAILKNDLTGPNVEWRDGQPLRA